jgi:predicted nuclease with TOPRIM domain
MLAFIQEKYQELYQAYSDKVEKVNNYEEQLDAMRSENQNLKEQLYRSEDKNEQLNATLLNKNVELEEAYRQFQEDIRRGNRVNKNDESLQRLE